MNKNKQSRVRCSDEQFLEAVFASDTYAEISQKTGQKLASTIARYARTRGILNKKGIDIPLMKRSAATRKTDAVEDMIEIVKKLKEYHSEE